MFQLASYVIIGLTAVETGSQSYLLQCGAGMGLAPGGGESEAETVDIHKKSAEFHEGRRHIGTICAAAVCKGSKRQARIQKSLTLFHFYSNSFYKVVRVIGYHSAFVFSECKNGNNRRKPCKKGYKIVLQSVKIKQFVSLC